MINISICVTNVLDLYGALVGVGELQAYEDEINGGINHRISFSLINIG